MEQIIKIDSRLELFVDKLLVDKMNDTFFKLHEPQMMPRPESPLPTAHYITVIKTDKNYQAWYRGRAKTWEGGKYDGNPGETTCYAQSTDGHNWTFPKLGLFEIDGSKENNVVLFELPCSHCFTPFIDTRTDIDPQQRYKALAGLHDVSIVEIKKHAPELLAENAIGGLYAFASPDGINWKKISQTPVIPSHYAGIFGFDSQNVSFWSEVENCYVCYFRAWETPLGRLRTIRRSVSDDYVNWSEPVEMNPNLENEHLYTSQTHPYFRAPHIYISLPTRYVAGRVGAEPADPMKGSTDILFMATRAGSTKYERLFTEAFIKPGFGKKRWKNRANYTALNVVPTGPQEMSIYHKTGERYAIRTDGFISVRAGVKTGELITKPVIHNGDRLILNYSTAAAGDLKVEIQNVDGKPIEGFSLDDCKTIVGDQIEQEVVFKSDKLLSETAETPIKLRFVMTECDLYSFRFMPE